MGTKRLFAAALVAGLVATITPVASGDALLGPLGHFSTWGTGTARGPVKCRATDITPDGRVFPEPQVSATFLTFSDFQCGVFLLEDVAPDRIDIDILGRSASGHPVYDVKLTNEDIPAARKQHLFILSSFHGNEMAGREGAARVIEDMVDARFMSNEPFIVETMNRFIVHFVFPNPDGWINGDVQGQNDAGVNYTRANNVQRRDLNRNFPVQGFLRASNGTQDTTEGRAVNALLLENADVEHGPNDPDDRGWYLGTDNHGQGVKPVAASGLQIVGEFDYEKSERLAHFADGIEGAMAEYGVLDVLQQLNTLTGGQVRPYEWGTLYDILGYSASGSGIDYYNTPGVVDGTGFATEMTGANNPASNFATHPALLNQMWVNSVRAINYTMMRDAVDPPSVTFRVGTDAAYVFDPEIVTDADDNGFGPGNAEIPPAFTGNRPDVAPDFKFASYAVTRMKFFEDLNRNADRPLDKLRVPEILDDPAVLEAYDTLVLADDPMPEGDNPSAWAATLRTFVEGGGNLIVTDAAAPILADLVAGIEPEHITRVTSDVGYIDFPEDRSHALNAGLRGIASQTYDVIPIGYPDNAGEAPNWRVSQTAWTAAGGVTTGTNEDETIYGEVPVGDGVIRFLGALLPQPTEDFFHPYGLQNYAVTYTGYTLLQNMLASDDAVVTAQRAPQ